MYTFVYKTSWLKFLLILRKGKLQRSMEAAEGLLAAFSGQMFLLVPPSASNKHHCEYADYNQSGGVLLLHNRVVADYGLDTCGGEFAD